MYQELQVQLTDPADPFFFYSLTLTESDFGALRRQQGLIVDFAQFPAMITKLADKASLLQLQVEASRLGPERVAFDLESSCSSCSYMQDIVAICGG